MKEYYISNTGKDMNKGVSPATSLSSFAKANELVVPGDIVYVIGGIYMVKDLININCRGNKENPITFRSCKEEVPVLDFSEIKGLHPKQFVVNFSQGAEYVVFDGFEICNSEASAIGVINCVGITVRNCKVHDIAHFGISIRSDNCLVENNEIYRIAMAWENCCVSGGWPQVVNTYFKPQVFPAVVGSYAYNNVFRGNFIHDCWGEGIDPIFGDGILIENNIIRDIFSAGIYLDSTRNTVIRNNFIYSTDDSHNRWDDKVPFHGIMMGCEYFGCWSVNPPISHNENIQIYNNLLSRVGSGISSWYDKLNTDYRNTFEKIKIFNNTIETYHEIGDGIRFADVNSVAPKDIECINNIIRVYKRDNPTSVGALEAYNWQLMNPLTSETREVDVLQQGLPDFQVGINVLKNPSFEEDGKEVKNTPIGWQCTGDKSAVSVVEDSFKGIVDRVYAVFVQSKNSHDPLNLNNDGQFCLNLAAKVPFTVYIYQTAEGMENGRYGLHARVKRFGEKGTFYMEAKDFGGVNIKCNIPEFNQFDSNLVDTDKKWFQLNMSDIVVADGRCTIGFYAKGSIQDYVMIDEVWLYRY